MQIGTEVRDWGHVTEQWQYKYVYVGSIERAAHLPPHPMENGSTVEAHSDALGARGWELVHVVTTTTSGRRHDVVLVFKRRVTE